MTPSPKTVARWPIAVAGVAMQMILGTVYAWSVFKKPLIAKHGWSELEVGLTFMLTIFFLGFSAALGGKLVDKAGTRKVASIAAALFSAGMVLAGLADTFSSKWLLWLGYGVIAGIGNGLGYITPVAVLVRWFPDKKGTITGLAVMGFGLGAAIMGQLAPFLMKYGVSIAAIFYASGAVFLAGMLLAARKLVNPPAEYALPAAKAATIPAVPSVDVSRAMTMYQFYILWGLLLLNVTAGIAIISNLSNMAQEQLKITAVAAGTIVFATSLCNGMGRLVWAALSEKIGRKAVFLILFASQVPLFFVLPHITNLWLFSIIACYILLCYGGGFGTMPSFTADTFGPKNIGGIYGKILLAWGVAGVAGPLLMEWVKKNYSGFQVALTVAAFVLAAGFILALLYRKPTLTATPSDKPKAPVTA